jgi:hypothetical protein
MLSNTTNEGLSLKITAQRNQARSDGGAELDNWAVTRKDGDGDLESLGQPGDIAYRESGSNRMSPLQPQCQARAERAGKLTDEYSWPGQSFKSSPRRGIFEQRTQSPTSVIHGYVTTAPAGNTGTGHFRALRL